MNILDIAYIISAILCAVGIILIVSSWINKNYSEDLKMIGRLLIAIAAMLFGGSGILCRILSLTLGFECSN